MNEKNEQDAVFAIALLPSLLAALGYSGWIGIKVDLLSCLVVAAVSGLIAGAIHGRRSVWGAFLYPIPFVVGTMTYILVTAWYLSDRKSVYKFELLIPLIIAFIPFGVVYWLTNYLVNQLKPKK